MAVHLSLETDMEILSEVIKSSTKYLGLMRYVLDTNVKLNKEKCPKGDTKECYIYIVISANPSKPPYIAREFCCPQFEEHIFSNYNIKNTVEVILLMHSALFFSARGSL